MLQFWQNLNSQYLQIELRKIFFHKVKLLTKSTCYYNLQFTESGKSWKKIEKQINIFKTKSGKIYQDKFIFKELRNTYRITGDFKEKKIRI